MSHFILKLTLATLLLIPSGRVTWGQTSQFESKAVEFDLIRRDLVENGRAHVVLELDSPSLENLEINEETIERRRAQIRAVQDSFLLTHFGTTNDSEVAGIAGSSFKRMGLSPLLALEGTFAQIENFAADERVTKVHSDKQLRPHIGENLQLVGAYGAHRLVSTSGQNQIVAVLDTGVDRSHPALSGKVVAEACFSTSDSAWYSFCPGGGTSLVGEGAAAPCTAYQSCYHGTAVAGTAAGSDLKPEFPGNVDRSVLRYIGVAAYADILAIQVFSGSRSGKQPTAFDSDILRALEHVFDVRNAFPGKTLASINLSLGTQATYPLACNGSFIAPMIATLRQANILTVIASGNSGDKDGVSHPGCVSSAFTVAASSELDRTTDFTNIGAEVDVFAPGREIEAPLPSGRYGVYQGTSFAAPHVAAAIASIKAAKPGLSSDEIEGALERRGAPIQDGGYTKPRIDILLAAEEVLGTILLPSLGGYFSVTDGRPIYPPLLNGTIAALGKSGNWLLEGGDDGLLVVSHKEGSAGPTPEVVSFKLTEKARELPDGFNVLKIALKNQSSPQKQLTVYFGVDVNATGWDKKFRIEERDGAKLVPPDRDLIFEGPDPNGFFYAGPPPERRNIQYELVSRAGPVSWELVGVPSWIKKPAKTKGNLQIGQREIFRFELSDHAKDLPPGTYEAKLKFLNHTFPQEIEKSAKLIIYTFGGGRLVADSTRLNFICHLGEVCSKSTAQIHLSSVGGSVAWNLTNLPTWLRASVVSGTTPATVVLTADTPNVASDVPFPYTFARYLEIRNSSYYQVPITPVVTMMVGP